MRPSKLVKRALISALALALCLGVPAPGALAAGIDMTKPCSLTVVLADGGRGIAGAEFELYRAGGFTESGGLELGGEFARCGVSLEGLDSSGWRAATQTLSAYARRDDIAPDGRAETGREGRALRPADARALPRDGRAHRERRPRVYARALPHKPAR